MVHQVQRPLGDNTYKLEYDCRRFASSTEHDIYRRSDNKFFARVSNANSNFQWHDVFQVTAGGTRGFVRGLVGSAKGAGSAAFAVQMAILAMCTLVFFLIILGVLEFSAGLAVGAGK